MKLFLALLMAILSVVALAKDVDGKLTYKLPSGDLVTRDVVINVPSRGQGEVVLSGKNFEWRTTNFKSFKRLGKDIFVAFFETEFMGMKSTLMFKGTYFKGNNTLMYVGDIYKIKKKKINHIGLFHFQYDR
jgi:hypothetical protein